MTSKCLFSALLLALGIQSGGALAIDGERLISLDTVIRGGITAGDAPGFPATITEPGSYKLSSNLGVGDGRDGISVLQSNVTINLNGWRIYGASGGRFGIAGPVGSDRVVVKNGVIQNFHRGVRSGGKDWTLQNVEIHNSRIAVQAGDNFRLDSSEITDNQDGGLECGSNCIIVNSAISRNGSAALRISSGIVFSNVIMQNGGLAVETPQRLAVGFGENTILSNNVVGGRQTNATPLSVNRCSPDPC